MKNKLISLLGLVSKAKYKALLASNDDWSQLCKGVMEELSKILEYSKSVQAKNAEMSSELMELTTEIKDLKDEINALNNLRASDQQTIKKLSNRKNMVYYTCGRLKREFGNQRELAKYLNVSQFKVNYMLNGKIKNKYKIKRHER